MLISVISSTAVTTIAAVTTKNKNLSAIIGLATLGLSFILQKWNR